MDPDGNVINPSEFIAISNAGLTSSLQFSPAQQSQGGRYTCQAIVNDLGASNFAEVEEAMSKNVCTDHINRHLNFDLHACGS